MCDDILKDSSERWTSGSSSGIKLTRAHEMEPYTWSSVMVEDLMQTSVIDSQNMAILKEHLTPGCGNDPSLMMNLRHDKLVRASLKSSRPSKQNAEVLAEAKRIIKLEDKERKAGIVQNRIVDNEIKRFQDHIVSLRKMNKRLDRLACSSNLLSKKKFEKEGAFKSHMCWDGFAEYPGKVREHLRIPAANSQCDLSPQHSCNEHGVNMQSECTNLKLKPQASFVAQKTLTQKETTNFIVSGSKLEEHEVLQYHSDPFIRGPIGHQHAVLEQVQVKFLESERLHRLNGKENNERHPSLINFKTMFNHEEFRDAHLDVVQPTVLVREIGTSRNREKELTLQANNPSVAHPASAQASSVQIDEWNASGSHSNVGKRLDKKSVEAKSSEPHLPPTISGNKTEIAKLDTLSSAYTKWMKSVCEEAGSCSKDPQWKERKKTIRDCEPMKAKDKKCINREEKIAQVLQAFQKNKQVRSNVLPNKIPHGSYQLSKSVNDLHNDKSNSEFKKSRRAVSGSYEHRLTAQNNIIIQQKVKLEEQRKQIEEFKFSQLQMEAERSRVEAQKNLSYVLHSGNESTKVHAKPIQPSFSFVHLSPGNAFVERMEQRAYEQRQKRLLSLERRKQFEEQCKLKMKEEEEKRRKDEEELARKRQEELLEIRRLERVAREEARKERERMIILENKAYAYSCRRKLKNGLHGFKKLVTIRKQEAAIADQFYIDHLMVRTIKTWKKHTDEMITAKMSVAFDFYKFTLIRHCFASLLKEHQLGTLRMQVAVDMYEFRLQDKVFRIWKQVTWNQLEVTAEKSMRADEFYSRILLRQFFSLWLKLPKVAQLEREKERRKTLLRRKVQQFLPDFRPAISSD